MKKISILLFILLTSMINIKEIYALDAYTTGTYVRVRTGAGATYTEIANLSEKNTYINLVDETLYNIGDPNCSAGWYKIIYNNSEAYICGLYVSTGTPQTPTPEYSTKGYEARIYGINITVKTTAGGSTTKTKLLPGTNVVIISDLISASGCSEGWYKIQYYKNDTGYVCSKYIRTKEQITASDTEYETYLRNLGFPDSYIPYLVKMHKDHPTWTFNPIQTNLYWDHVVSGEELRNGINYTYLDSINTSLYRAQDWEYESGYYRSTNAVNAFFLDPRNWLTEKFVFMFESLNYNYGTDGKVTLNPNSEQTKIYYNTIKNIFSNSYLNTDLYINMYIGAGFTYNVNPVHLATRTFQEGGANETYSAITGTNNRLYGTYSVYGYYNYYNIGAYKDSVTSDPIIRGLAYACGKACGAVKENYYGQPWDTREKAIYGGAAFIADGYIDAGQQTLYFQKFNTNPATTNSIYGHQYQTNITAPTHESASAYTSYLEMGLLELPYQFDIPIYLNMPEVVSLPSIASTTNTLNDIKVNGSTVPGFDIDILEYTAYVKIEDTKANITVAKTDELSTVTGTGEITLTGEKTEHEIIVTAENGATKTYKITLVKVTDTTTVNDIISKLSVKTNGEYMMNISPETLASTIKQSILKQSPTANVTITNSGGTVVSDTNLLTTSQKIKIESPSGDTKTFTLIVTGDTNGDGKADLLDLLRVQKHLVGTNILTDANLKGADTNNDNQVTILDLLRVQRFIKKEIKL